MASYPKTAGKDCAGAGSLPARPIQFVGILCPPVCDKPFIRFRRRVERHALTSKQRKKACDPQERVSHSEGQGYAMPIDSSLRMAGWSIMRTTTRCSRSPLRRSQWYSYFDWLHRADRRGHNDRENRVSTPRRKWRYRKYDLRWRWKETSNS